MLRFNGCTAKQRLDALDAPADWSLQRGDRVAAGVSRAGRREGPWRYSVDGEERFLVHFIDDRPVAPPAGWLDADWPGLSLAEDHLEERELLEIVLREYRRPEDIERIYRLVLPRTGNSIPVVRALMNALGIPLQAAKVALDAACDRAKGR